MIMLGVNKYAGQAMNKNITRISGRVWKFGDNIDTDVIIPGKYLRTTDMSVFASHVMEGIDPLFSQKVQKGDIIVAGKNFGCGSSREQAPLALKHAGIACVVAESFARIFFRNPRCRIRSFTSVRSQRFSLAAPACPKASPRARRIFTPAGAGA